MNKNSIIDYWGCILFRAVGSFIRCLPKNFSFFLGRRLGDFLFCFDVRHRAVAYSNIKTAFGQEKPPSELFRITKEFYRAFGQNLIEVFLVPLVDKKYLDKYVAFEGLENISAGFKKGKGVILLVVHEGSWELSNIIGANLGFPYVVFVQGQKYPRLNKLLNSYRGLKGSKVIYRKGGIRQLIEALGDNCAVGMTMDQGGKNGVLVKFFGQYASMATGALKLGLRYDAAIIPVFYTRVKGPFTKVFIEPAFEIKKSADSDKDIQSNLQRLVGVYEKYIFKYPKELFWTYKIWKYTKEKSILLLNDAKAGHVRQAQGVARLVSDVLKERGIEAKIESKEIRFKNNFSKYALIFSSFLAGKYNCQGCSGCLKSFLKSDVYDGLISAKPDIIISCGASAAPINFILARENMAKSIVVMRPSVLSMKRFDLVIMPKHDCPPKRKNVVVTEGALNLIDEVYLKEETDKLIRNTQYAIRNTGFYIGLLIGGDTKNFTLNKDTVLGVIKQVKAVSESLNAGILITTSRRSSKEVEALVKEEFRDYPRCKMLIVANEKNVPEAVGGILGLSKIIVTSPDSLSMVSEAVSSNKYTFVFKSSGLDGKHKRFLDYFARNKYIYLVDILELGKKIDHIWRTNPSIYTPKDNLLVVEAVKRIM